MADSSKYFKGFIKRKGYNFWKVYERGTFSIKNGIPKGKGLDLRAEPPLQTLLSEPHPTPPPPPGK